jgi:hypothetical protein
VAAQPPKNSPSVIPDKPADNYARFHPEMPQIPGVNDGSVASSPKASRTAGRNFAKIGGIAGAALLIGFAIVWWIVSVWRRPSESPAPETASVGLSLPTQPSPEPNVTTPASAVPGFAATVEELSKPWAAKTFNFVKPIGHENVKAIVIRLPGGGLWSFALQEPYGRCNLEFVTDLNQLAMQYGYRAKHPMVVNPCNSAIYDPLKVGSAGGDVWARGEIVQGNGLRPPISIDVQEKGHSIIALRIE